MNQFREERRNNIRRMAANPRLAELGVNFVKDTLDYKYSFNFDWLGRPIIQFPQDIIAMQEIIWRVRPDLIIETGIAHGGSLVFYASILELIGKDGEVLGIDIDIRPHNRAEIENHPMSKRITMMEGSSIDEKIAGKVSDFAAKKSCILVALDSNHSYEHVLRELNLYSTLVTRGSYLVVFDTAVEDMPSSCYSNRPWGKGNNPRTAVQEFLSTNDRFEIDRDIGCKLLITASPDGYLKCLKD